MYLATSFGYFCFAGVLALIIRAQLFAPGLHLVGSKEQYNQLFTMHGTIMMLLFATPLFAGFANAIMPLKVFASITVRWETGRLMSAPAAANPIDSRHRDDRSRSPSQAALGEGNEDRPAGAADTRSFPGCPARTCSS